MSDESKPEPGPPRWRVSFYQWSEGETPDDVHRYLSRVPCVGEQVMLHAEGNGPRRTVRVIAVLHMGETAPDNPSRLVAACEVVTVNPRG